MVAPMKWLWRSTPMRMALALVVLFTCVSLLSLGGAFYVIRTSIQETIRTSLTQDLAGFRAAPTAGALATLVAAEAEAIDPATRILSYRSRDGRHFGNGLIVQSQNGFEVVTPGNNPSPVGGEFLALSAVIHGGRLTLATNLQQTWDLRETFRNILLMSLLPTGTITLLSGMVIARRSGRRIEALEGTLDKLTSGDLSARTPEMPGRVDDLSNIAARVDRMAQAQQTSVSVLKQVSADIAHDLKTPIQRVAVLLNRLRETDGLCPQAAQIVAQAGAETDGIVTTFQALLQIAQIEGGSPKSRFAPVDLGRLGADFVDVYGPAAEDGHHRLSFAAPRGVVTVSGDKGLLGQVFANLIENALRHTPPDSAIEVRVEPVDGAVRLSVRDTGPGIPEAERANVLRRLYRLEQSRRTPGSGLGLSLVRVVAQLHDARLELGDGTVPETPAEQKGLLVSLTFPAL
ncbi:MAG: signal transduction histidine kinase [Paracoccaceae bacterium]|jgi:signal transduction histidine kinase